MLNKEFRYSINENDFPFRVSRLQKVAFSIIIINRNIFR